MPSKHQTGAKSDDYDSEEKKMLATKNDLTIAALIRGIRDPDRAQAYIDAEVELADDEDRDVRKEIIGACNRKKTALEDAHADATDVDVDATDTPDEDEDDDTGDDGRQDDANDDGDGPTVTPEADYPVFDDRDALEQAVEDHGCADTTIVAKPDGSKAVCFECESYIGIVPRADDADAGFDGDG